jgi:hypothetical protein
MPDSNSPRVTRAEEDSFTALIERGDQSRLNRKWSCPSDHMIAVYTDGVLGKRKRAWVEFHLARCDRCRMVVADVVKTQRHSDPLVPPVQLIRKAMGLVEKQPLSRRWVWAPAGVLAGIALVAAVTVVSRKQEQLTFPAPPVPSSPLVSKSEPVATPRAALRDIVRAPQRAEQLPTILSPRPDSILQAERLQFSWKPISHSRNYEVKVVRADGDVVWTGETEKSALQVPADVSLRDGPYFAWVTAYLEDGRNMKSAPVRFLIAR